MARSSRAKLSPRASAGSAPFHARSKGLSSDADANVGQAIGGLGISEEEDEITLYAEEPVVEKRAVPRSACASASRP